MNLPDLIETDRLTLRPLRASDAGPMTHYSGDRRVAEMMEHIPHPYPPGAAAAYIERVLAKRLPEQVWVLDAGRIEGPEFIGLIRLRKEGADAARLDYWVGPPFWNTGYASEAALALIEAARGAGLARVEARLIAGNEASAHVLANAGFRETGGGEVFSVGRDAMAPFRLYARSFAEGGKA